MLQKAVHSLVVFLNTPISKILGFLKPKKEVNIPNLGFKGGENVDNNKESALIESATLPVDPVGQMDTVKEVDPEAHKHEWDLFSKTYGQAKGNFDARTAEMPQDLMEKILFGVTTLLWKCVLCSETKKEEVLGTDESQVEDLLTKAINFGPQYLQRDGITFVISKWQSVGSQGTNIPLR